MQRILQGVCLDELEGFPHTVQTKTNGCPSLPECIVQGAFPRGLPAEGIQVLAYLPANIKSRPTF